MNPASDIVNAVLSGNIPVALKLVIAFVMVHYFVFLCAYAKEKLLIPLLNWARGEANKLPFFSTSQIDDRFFDILEKAAANQANLQQAVSLAFADGNVTPEELKKIVEAIWADFKANVGISDWSSFAQALLGNASAPAAATETKLRAMFDANVYQVLGRHSSTVSARSLQRKNRKMQLRFMAADAATREAMAPKQATPASNS